VLRLRSEFSFFDWGEPDDVVDEIEGEILHGDDGPLELAGRFCLYKIPLCDAQEAGYSHYVVFDSHGQALVDRYGNLFDWDTGEFSDAVEDAFEPLGRHLLVIDGVEILHRHRGKGLGIAVVRRLIQLYGQACGIAACHPCPMVHDPGYAGDDAEFYTRLDLGRFVRNEATATRKLLSYWSRLGFRRVGRTCIFARPIHEPLPELEALCGPEFL
jgi:hypothetical protein